MALIVTFGKQWNVCLNNRQMKLSIISGEAERVALLNDIRSLGVVEVEASDEELIHINEKLKGVPTVNNYNSYACRWSGETAMFIALNFF